MAIYEIASDGFKKIEETTFVAAGIKERSDLQRLLREQIDVVLPETLVIAEEFGEWTDSRRRIDLLGLDKDANLVVIELKRSDDGGNMELQAIRYAAMVRTMTFDKVVDVFGRFSEKRGCSHDPRAAILRFLGWEEPDEERFAQDVRIVLVSADFSREVTTSVMWLNTRGLDIRCVVMKPYQFTDRTLIDVRQLIPLPEAADYQIKIREKEECERDSRRGKSERAQRYIRFWKGVLAKTNARTHLFANISPGQDHYMSASIGIGGVKIEYVVPKNSARVQLYIHGSSLERNKRVYDALAASRSEIDEDFGERLHWQRMDDNVGCVIAKEFEGGGLAYEGDWPKFQETLVDAMCGLERAVRPHLERIKDELDAL